MRKIFIGLLAASALTLAACSTDSTPTPTTSTTPVVSSTPAVSSATVYPPDCMLPTPKNASYTIKGSTVSFKVPARLCVPLYVRIVDWKYLSKGSKFPQAQVAHKDVVLTGPGSFTLPKLIGQQDIYASAKNDLAVLIPQTLTGYLKGEPYFLNHFATGPAPYSAAPLLK